MPVTLPEGAAEKAEIWTRLLAGEPNNGDKVQRQQMEIETDTLPFTCDILGTTWGSGREHANIYVWTPPASDAAGTYHLYVEITDGASDSFGFSKSADITPEEFVAYLNAAAPSKVTAG